MASAVSMRTLYFRPGLVARPDSGCAVLYIAPLLRELIVEAARIGQLLARHRDHCALRDLTILHLTRATSAPTEVRLPRDGRALAVAQRILEDPAESKTLPMLCTHAGVGVRTMQRIFQSDVGVDFDSWRRQVRLTKAVELLIAGHSVKQVAFAVGYNQPSGFVEAFRRTFGVTPKVWTASIRNPSTISITGGPGK
jgi:AraC-like DNA-binding protein